MQFIVITIAKLCSAGDLFIITKICTIKVVVAVKYQLSDMN